MYFNRRAFLHTSSPDDCHSQNFFFLNIFSKFNFSQTVGEMVFVSFEVEKMRMFLVQSVFW